MSRTLDDLRGALAARGKVRLSLHATPEGYRIEDEHGACWAFLPATASRSLDETCADATNCADLLNNALGLLDGGGQ